jgi:uncharacterized MAPEG superfamily protein
MGGSMDGLLPYQGLLCASAVLAALALIQVVVVDFASIRAKHVPGMPVTDGHGSFLFRATRAHGNTNENLPVQILLTLLAVLLAADPRWATGAAWAFVAARAGHMLFYYFDLRILRSIAFGAGLLAQLVLLVVVGLAVGGR